MKKVFYLICALFVITGCEATYTINIDDDFNESLILTAKNSAEFNEINDGSYLYPAFYDSNFTESDDLEIISSQSSDIDDDLDFDEELDDEEDEEDDIIIEEDNDIAFDEDDPDADERYNLSVNNNTLTYSYKFGSRYQDSHIALSSVDDFEAVNSTSDVYSSFISATDFSTIFNEYPNLTKLTINVVTNKKVISSNADSIRGNVYTWVITSKNYNRTIQIFYVDDRYYDNIVPIYDYISNNGGSNSSNNGSNNNSNNGSSNDPNGSSNNGSNNGSSSDPNGGSNNGSSDDPNGTSNNSTNNNSNNSENNYNSTSKNSKKSKQSKVILYVLYSLFFGLIFGIMIVRTIKGYKKK